MGIFKSGLASIDSLINVKLEDVTTMLDFGVEIEGVIRIRTDHAILISGHVIGSIESKGAVVIDENAEVHGSITAKSLQISGKVLRRSADDKLIVHGPVILAKTGHMGCDVECQGIQINFGASIDGKIQPGEPLVPAPAVKAEPLVQAAVPVRPVTPVPSAVANETPKEPSAADSLIGSHSKLLDDGDKPHIPGFLSSGLAPRSNFDLSLAG